MVNIEAAGATGRTDANAAAVRRFTPGYKRNPFVPSRRRGRQVDRASSATGMTNRRGARLRRVP